MDAVAIIPARYGSTRFPGKALARIGNKTMIQRVYERASSVRAFRQVIVATDDRRILDTVEGFGGKAVMTSSSHPSGTDRCAEVAAGLPVAPDVVVNVQGDEPFLATGQLERVLDCFRDPITQIATLAKKITEQSVLENPHTPKVVFDARHRALYFSRSPIPYLRGTEGEWWPHFDFYKHIGVYGYTGKVLAEIVRLPRGRLEMAESLEQLRWLENGYAIQVAETQEESVAIDTPDDLAQVLARMAAGAGNRL